MKVAVYAIALNEADNVTEWAAAAKDADVILIADTGSTDGTRLLAQKAGVSVIDVRVIPWRFDVARNSALVALPEDIDWCIALDLDERLQPGWREALEKVPDYANRAAFWYTWNLEEDGSPGLQFWRDFVHRRHGFFWKHMIHETLTRYELSPEIAHLSREMQVVHYQDLNKERRGKYLSMLQMACKEDPMADRHSSWLAREYLYAGHKEEAAAEFQRHIALPTATWAPEVAASMYLLSTIERSDRLHWLGLAEQKAPERREFKMRLAEYYYERRDWKPVLYWASRALAITERPEDYLSEPFAWGPLVHEYRYMALFHLGRLGEAIEAAERALELAEPEDRDRIAGNLAMMQEKTRPPRQALVVGD